MVYRLDELGQLASELGLAALTDDERQPRQLKDRFEPSQQHRRDSHLAVLAAYSLGKQRIRAG